MSVEQRQTCQGLCTEVGGFFGFHLNNSCPLPVPCFSCTSCTQHHLQSGSVGGFQTSHAYPESFLPKENVFSPAGLCSSHFVWMHIKSLEVWKDLLIEQQRSSYDLILLFLLFYHFFSHIPLSAESDNWRTNPTRLEGTLGTCSEQRQPRLCRTLWTEKLQPFWD